MGLFWEPAYRSCHGNDRDTKGKPKCARTISSLLVHHVSGRVSLVKASNVARLKTRSRRYMYIYILLTMKPKVIGQAQGQRAGKSTPSMLGWGG